MTTKKHESYMRWAVALALEGMGRTSPNPMVGAVIVKKDRITGQGYHHMAGTPHAEIHALREAGRKSAGADMYVTLEPCPHEGRTPPCVDAIVDAGIKRVFVGTRDPNPMVSGRGIRALKKNGVTVVEGVLALSCRQINEPYNKFMTSGMPFVTAKVALSLDGKIATQNGDSRWITNDECRRYVHRLRGQTDAVLVGGKTARKDNPKLNVRLANFSGIEPKAVIIDEKLTLPKKLGIFKRKKGQLIIATTDKASKTMLRWVSNLGHEVIICKKTYTGKVNLKDMFFRLGKFGIMSVLVEGGGLIFAELFRRQLIDHMVVCIAPKLIGGLGLDFLPEVKIRSVGDAATLKDVTVQIFGDNIVVEGNPNLCSQA